MLKSYRRSIEKGMLQLVTLTLKSDKNAATKKQSLSGTLLTNVQMNNSMRSDADTHYKHS